MLKSIETQKNLSAKWRCPSNIAIIKYWGKHGIQLPKNASISFTLENAHTETRLTLSPSEIKDKSKLVLFLDGVVNEKFGKRIQEFFNSISDNFFPFLSKYDVTIETKNTFPHSSGIASSASGMGALALCLCDIETQILGTEMGNEAFFRKASEVARLGSGSASRSIFPYLAVWGKHQEIIDSSDQYAIGFEKKTNDVFKTFINQILIASPEEKSVSSSVGHALMNTNPYANTRYKQAENNMSVLIDSLQSGDINTFGRIAEEEALTLHALMMCSSPSFILMKENSLTLINKIRAFRSDTNIPVFFTLDAGPNIHLLYPEAYEKSINSWIDSELRPLCDKSRILKDKVGKGPIKIE